MGVLPVPCNSPAHAGPGPVCYFRATFPVKSSYESENFQKYPRRPFVAKATFELLFFATDNVQLNGPKKVAQVTEKSRGGKVDRESSYFLLGDWPEDNKLTMSR